MHARIHAFTHSNKRRNLTARLMDSVFRPSAETLRLNKEQVKPLRRFSVMRFLSREDRDIKDSQFRAARMIENMKPGKYYARCYYGPTRTHLNQSFVIFVPKESENVNDDALDSADLKALLVKAMVLKSS